MNTQVMHDSIAKSLEGNATFPDVVRALVAEGVERYHTDLTRLEKTFYMPDGATHVEKIAFPAQPIAQNFSASDVLAAIRDIQAGKDKYKTFLSRIMAAGTTSYTVFLSGKKAIYFGRDGEFHIEEFPRAKQ